MSISDSLVFFKVWVGVYVIRHTEKKRKYVYIYLYYIYIIYNFKPNPHIANNFAEVAQSYIHDYSYSHVIVHYTRRYIMNITITEKDRRAISRQFCIIKDNTVLVHTHCKDSMTEDLLRALRIMYCNARYLEQRCLCSTDSSIELINQLLIDYYKLAAILKDTDKFCDTYLKDTKMRITHIKNYLQSK